MHKNDSQCQVLHYSLPTFQLSPPTCNIQKKDNMNQKLYTSAANNNLTDELLAMSLKELLTLGETYNGTKTTEQISKLPTKKRIPFGKIENKVLYPVKCSRLNESQKSYGLDKVGKDNAATPWSKSNVIRRKSKRCNFSPIRRLPTSRKTIPQQPDSAISLWRNVIKTQHGRRCKNLL